MVCVIFRVSNLPRVFVDNMTVGFSAGMERKENSVDKEGPVPL